MATKRRRVRITVEFTATADSLDWLAMLAEECRDAVAFANGGDDTKQLTARAEWIEPVRRRSSAARRGEDGG